MKKLVCRAACLLFFIAASTSLLKAQTAPVKVLLVTAHPDDETTMAATVYKIIHQQGGLVDQAVITNGEGGYRYSLLAEPYYHLQLTNESVGREALPRIRKQELLSAGRILGIRNHYFFDQRDTHFGLDEREPLDTAWNSKWVETRLKKLLQTAHYDFVFCLLPDSATHAHHKAATILVLRSLDGLKEKPVVLAVTTSNKKDSAKRTFVQLRGQAITRISGGKPFFHMDRTTSFGFNNRLNYKMVVNWVIAEHKSQGTLQATMNEGDCEDFWFFDVNDAGAFQRTELFFEGLMQAKTNQIVKQ